MGWLYLVVVFYVDIIHLFLFGFLQVEIYKSFRPGDIVLAKVVSFIISHFWLFVKRNGRSGTSTWEVKEEHREFKYFLKKVLKEGRKGGGRRQQHVQPLTFLHWHRMTRSP